MFDTLLNIILFSLASLFVRLFTLRLSISTKHLSLFSFITDINGFFEIPKKPDKNLRPPSAYFDLSSISRL